MSGGRRGPPRRALRRRGRRRGTLRRACATALLSLGLTLGAQDIGAQSALGAPGLGAQDRIGASLGAFLEAFHYAFRDHDRDAAVVLFYWRGVTERDRARIMSLLERDLAFELRGVRLMPPGDLPQRFEADGILMRRNLPVVARLLARFATGEGETHYSLHDLGLEDDAFYIVLAAPESGI